MLCIVDGTGDFDEKSYKADMANSFCSQLSQVCKGLYFRGPSIEGARTFEKSKIVAKHVIEQGRCGPTEKIYLAGHSRGGAAVIHAAQILKRYNVFVDAMFLFDAVDRTFHFDVDVSKIPGNVRRCYHARRFPHLSEHFKKEVLKAREKWDEALRNGAGSATARATGQLYEQVRIKDLIVRKFTRSESISEIGFASIDFGNCGVQGEGACRYSQHFFLGTHGAIGGAPDRRHGVTELTSIDAAAVAAVRAWMNGALAREGLLQIATP